MDFVDAKGMTAISRCAEPLCQCIGIHRTGYNVTKVAAAVDKELKAYDVPEGYTIEMAGEDETIRESMTELMKMLLLAGRIYLPDHGGTVPVAAVTVYRHVHDSSERLQEDFWVCC